MVLQFFTAIIGKKVTVRSSYYRLVFTSNGFEVVIKLYGIESDFSDCA